MAPTDITRYHPFLAPLESATIRPKQRKQMPRRRVKIYPSPANFRIVRDPSHGSERRATRPLNCDCGVPGAKWMCRNSPPPPLRNWMKT
jgi:hypothetical protein